jgi:hypothetical protein
LPILLSQDQETLCGLYKSLSNKAPSSCAPFSVIRVSIPMADLRHALAPT